jgi:hypothetical protein
MSLYLYAKGDLLIDRNTYFYTKYEDLPFLEAWQADRSRIAALLGQAIDPPGADVSFRIQQLIEKINGGYDIETTILLEGLYSSLTMKREGLADDVVNLIDQMVNRHCRCW